jgi:hydrogenase-4 membrane subunit HyfE
MEPMATDFSDGMLWCLALAFGLVLLALVLIFSRSHRGDSP